MLSYEVGVYRNIYMKPRSEQVVVQVKNDKLRSGDA